MELRAMIAEVNNTFDERHMYFLPATELQNRDMDAATRAQDCDGARRFCHKWPKVFHVSPFSSRKGAYSLVSSNPHRASTGLALSTQCLQQPIHITATQLSSKGRAKLVARLRSEGDPIDPAHVSVPRFLHFFTSWCWVGLITCG